MELEVRVELTTYGLQDNVETLKFQLKITILGKIWGNHIISLAFLSSSLKVCVYKFNVVFIEECPSLDDTTFMLTPLLINKVAWVCLRS